VESHNHQKVLLILFLICSFVYYIPEKVQATDSTEYEWPKFRHDLLNTGYTDGDGPDSNHTIWTYQTGGKVFSSPSIANGRLYVGSNDDNVYCLDAFNGSLIWKYATGGDVLSSPAVANDRIYVGSNDDKLYCLNAINGSIIWSYETGWDVFSSPLVNEGRVYFGSFDCHMYCLNASDGSIIWDFLPFGQNQRPIWSSPSLSNGIVWYGHERGKLIGFNATTGIGKREPVIAYGIAYSSSAIFEDRIFYGSYDLRCFNASSGNDYLWIFPVDAYIYSSPAIAYGKIYFYAPDTAEHHRNLYCLDILDGFKLWNYSRAYSDWSSPAVANNKVYLGAESVYCFDANSGEILWTYTLDSFTDSSPAIAYGNLYIGSDQGKIYCFGRGHSACIEFVSGWNLIAFPTRLTNYSIYDIFQNNLTRVNNIFGYDKYTKTWLYWIKGLPSELQKLHSLQEYSGYWVEVNSNFTQKINYFR